MHKQGNFSCLLHAQNFLAASWGKFYDNFIQKVHGGIGILDPLRRALLFCPTFLGNPRKVRPFTASSGTGNALLTKLCSKGTIYVTSIYEGKSYDSMNLTHELLTHQLAHVLDTTYHQCMVGDAYNRPKSTLASALINQVSTPQVEGYLLTKLLKFHI